MPLWLHIRHDLCSRSTDHAINGFHIVIPWAWDSSVPATSFFVFFVRFSPLLPLRWWDPLPFFSSILFACFSRVCAPKRNETSARRSLVAVHSSRAVFVFIWQRAGNKLVVAQGITAATLSETGFSVEKLLILRCVFISISVLCCPARAQRQLLPYIIRENREKEREKYVHYVNGCAASHFPFDSISFCLCVAVFRFDFRFFSVLVIPFSWKCSGVSTAIHYTHEWEAWMMHDNTLSIQWIYGTFTVFYLDISPLRAAAVFFGATIPIRFDYFRYIYSLKASQCNYDNRIN